MELNAQYLKAHPGCEMQEAFDYIRDDADNSFKQQIKDLCLYSPSLPDQKLKNSIDIIYIDKNNTPDHWDINS